MKHTIRAFSIGLISAGIVFLIIFLATDSKPEVKKMETNQMIDQLETKGYHVLNQSDYIALSVNHDNQLEKDKEQAKEKEKKAKDEKETKDEKEKKDKDAKKDNKADKKDDQKKQDKKEDKEKKDKKEKKKAKSYTINIKSGMVSSDIAKELKEHGIIKDAFKFGQYLEKEGYARKIQLGKFKVNSDMSKKEIAKSFTR